MPNGYTYGVVDGTFDTKAYLEACARSRGFAIMQRDAPAGEKVKYRVRSDYYDKSLKEDKAALAAWNNMSKDEVRAMYDDYVAKQKAYNKKRIAEVAEIRARIQAVRDEITPLKWPVELHSMRDDALKYLDETEEWDCKIYQSPIDSFDNWVSSHADMLSRSVTRSQEGVYEENKRVMETNNYIDLFHGVINQL